MKISKSFENYLYFFFLVISSLIFFSNSGNSLFYTPGYLKILICLIIFVYAYFKYSDYSFIRMINIKHIINFFTENGLYSILNIYIPYLCIFLYTIILFLVGMLLDGQIKSAITMFGSMMGCMLLIPATVYLFKKNGIYFWMFSTILNYTIIICSHVAEHGILSLLNVAESAQTSASSFLEAHELIFIFGIFILYLMLKNNKKKFDYALLGIFTFFIYLGFKRITLLALACIVCFVLFVKYFKLDNYKFYLKFNCLIMICIFIYLFFSTYGLEILNNISETTGVDFMGRLRINKYFIGTYDGVRLITGNGFMFGETYLAMSPYMKYYSAVHNDILRIFLDCGIFGVIGFCLNFLFIFLNRIYENYPKSMLFFELALMYSVIHFTTDNLIIYPRYISMLAMCLVYCEYLTNENVFISECSKKYSISDIHKIFSKKN